MRDSVLHQVSHVLKEGDTYTHYTNINTWRMWVIQDVKTAYFSSVAFEKLRKVTVLTQFFGGHGMYECKLFIVKINK